jgi:hypothetical protein
MLKDITIQHGDFGTVQPEIIHISVKGKSLGTGSFLGMLLRHIEKEKGTDSGMAAFSLRCWLISLLLSMLMMLWRPPMTLC